MTIADPQPELAPEQQRALRGLPSISRLLQVPEIMTIAERMRPEPVTQVLQGVVEQARQDILRGVRLPSEADIVAVASHSLARLTAPRLEPVINGTGVIIHTNLGRAPLSQETAAAMTETAIHYTPLELELSTGQRGGRMSEVSRLLRLLTGAEASLVVNNNAAAVLLVLSALATGREVVLSRSQAVEIGGGFRVPDVMAQSGARLVEVGTTNRSYGRDYEAAITDETAALLTVHPSNFRIVGFTAQPSLHELAEIARRHGVALIEDLGSGALLDTSPYGLAHEPTVAESLQAGVDIVCFSGDKLLGGPQAGVIVGRADLVAEVARHPLARAVRADKTALAGVAATLRHYLRADATETIPVWRMISASVDELTERCEQWRARLEMAGIDGLRIEPNQATVGGGSLPGETMESRALTVPVAVARARGLTLNSLAAALRSGELPLMPRVDDDRLVIDARTVFLEQDDAVVQALTQALRTTD